MSDFCPILSADPAVIYVGDAHSKFIDLATRTYDLAVNQANMLGGFVAQPTQFNVGFNFAGQLPSYQKPLAPQLNVSDFDLRAPPTPAPPPNFNPDTPELLPVPIFDVPAPTVAFGAKPGTPSIQAPTAPARPAPLVIPTAPNYELPQVPNFEQLNLPAAPVITLPSFDARRPVFIPPELNETWSFNPEPYASSLMDKLKQQIGTWIEGESALPIAIQNAIFDRGRSRQVIETRAAVDQVWNEFAARGFTSPPGMLATRVDVALQGGQDRIAELNRETTITAFMETLANVRLALQQGVALESLAVNLHIEQQRQLLQAAQFVRESAIAVLNAKIAVFNAEIAGYQADAQVSEQRIRAELAKVEVFRAQIEGERARGEINEQRVRLYAEQMRALSVMADFHRSAIEAVKAQADVNRAVIDGYRAEVDAYSSRWEAYGKEWDGYRAGVEAENAKVSIHRNLVEAFQSQVQAVTSGNSGLLDRERLRIAQHGQLLDIFRGNLARDGQLLDTERARLSSVAQRVDAQARIYSAQGIVEQSASAAADRIFSLGLERERANVDTQLKVAEIRSTEHVQLTNLALDLRKMLTQVMSQLAASTMSAVNYSASLGSSRSDSRSCNTSYTLQGEIADG
ncbi:MAG: hypothetical protein ACREP7_14940 [Lysobacter sp.]